MEGQASVRDTSDLRTADWARAKHPALTGSPAGASDWSGVLIKRAVMEGILRQAPRLPRPPAAEAGPLEVGWASCGCRAVARIQAGST